MNPFSPRSSPEIEAFERELRQGARSIATGPSPELHGRILAAIRRAPRARAIVPVPPARRWWPAAAAAALVIATGAWFWRARTASVTRDEAGVAGRELVVASRGLFSAGSRVLRLPELAEGNLRSEAEFLLSDATRAAERIVGGLARPLRDPLRAR